MDALPIGPGDVVLDVGCGTGLCCGLLRDKVGAQGGVVGIEESSEMLAVAQQQARHGGWRNVSLMRSAAEDAEIAEPADAALFCAVHDILQSPQAVWNIVGSLRPGAWVVAGGAKWASRLMVPVNVCLRTMHGPYVRSFDGFDRPWRNLEQVTEDVHVRELACGSRLHHDRPGARQRGGSGAAGRPVSGAAFPLACAAWPPRNSAMTGTTCPGLSTSAR